MRGSSGVGRRVSCALALAACGAISGSAAAAQGYPSATGRYTYWHQITDVTYATNSVCEATGTVDVRQNGRDLTAQVSGTQRCLGRRGYDATTPLTLHYGGRIDPPGGGFVLQATNAYCTMKGAFSPKRAWGDGEMSCTGAKGKFKLTNGPGAQVSTGGARPDSPRYTEGLYQDDYVDGTKNGGYVESPTPPQRPRSPASPPPGAGSRPMTPAPVAPAPVTPASGAYSGTPGAVVSAPAGRPARYYPTQLFVTVTGPTPAGRRVRNACADINVGGVTTRVLGDVSYYTPNASSAGTFQVQATLTRPDMWAPGDYPVTITAATNCARDGAYLVFDPLSTSIRVEYPASGGLVGRGFRFDVRTR